MAFPHIASLHLSPCILTKRPRQVRMAGIEFTVNHGHGDALSPVRTNTAG